MYLKQRTGGFLLVKKLSINGKMKPKKQLTCMSTTAKCLAGGGNVPHGGAVAKGHFVFDI